MEQIISNVWQLNALLGGIILLIALLIASVVIIISLFAILLHPFVRHFEE